MSRLWRILFWPILIIIVLIGVYRILPAPITNSGERTMVDARGDTVHLPQYPQRIMAISSALDLVLLDFLPKEKILAVVKDSQSPFSSLRWQEAREIKKNYGRTPGAEEIIALQPDLVFMPDYTSDDVVSAVRAIGIPVVVVKTPEKVNEVHTMVRQVGEALGEPQTAERILKKFDDEIELSLARTNTIPPEQRRKVIFISSMVGYGGTGSLFADANRYSGLINAAAAAGIPAHTAFTEERLVDMDPDVIFIPTYSNGPSKLVQHFYTDKAYASLSAVRNRRVLPLRPAYLYNSSITLPEGIAAVQCVGYKERFPELAEKYMQPVPTSPSIIGR